MNESDQPSRSLTLTKLFGIIGAIALIAIVAVALLMPAHYHDGGISLKNECINNLRLIDGAKQTWALEHNKGVTEIPTWTDIEPYLGRNPTDHVVLKCPSGGTYTLGTVSNAPTCSIPGHALP